MACLLVERLDAATDREPTLLERERTTSSVQADVGSAVEAGATESAERKRGEPLPPRSHLCRLPAQSLATAVFRGIPDLLQRDEGGDCGGLLAENGASAG